MPAFPNSSKVLSQVVAQIGVAIFLEASYEDAQWGDDPFDGSREEFVTWLQSQEEEEEEIVPEEYEEFRDRYHGDLDHMDLGYSIYSHHNY
jgi:hypothetical protein